MTQTMIPEDDKVYLKRYLAQYYNAKRRQDILKKRLAKIRRELDHPSVPSPQLNRGPVTKNYNSMPPLLIKLAEIEDRINQQVEIEAKVVLEVMKTLDFLPAESTEKEIMELRHIDCMPWNEIMRQTHFSRAQCFRYYNAGLERLYGYKKVRQSIAQYRDKVERTEKDGY